MAERKIYHYYKNALPNDDFSKWPVSSTTSCWLIGQPTVTWANLGSLFGKHNYYQDIIPRLLEPDQNLYNVIHFCENNPNCVEIEIAKRKEYIFNSGHHIFASRSVDLTKLIDLPSVTNTSADKNVTVKWICNYGPEQEAPLDQFLTIIQDLKTDPQKCGIAYKWDWSLSDTYEEHRHLSFLLDLRRYCGDVSRFNHDPYNIRSTEQLIDYVDQFHKKYVVPNTPPSQQIAWTFLLTLGSSNYDCQYINKNLKWDNVKSWTVKLAPVIGLRRQFINSVQISGMPSTNFVKTATEQLKQVYDKECNQSVTTLLVDTLKSMESSFTPSADPNSPTADQIEATVHQFKAFLEKKHLVQNAGKLVEQMNSAPSDDNVIFAIYKQLFNILIIKDLKNPDSKAVNILSFMFQNVQKNGLVASISVPDSGGKKLILVVNNLGDVKADEMKPLMFDFVKRKAVPAPFAKSRFSLFFDNKIHADLGSVEAFNLFKTIVPEENVDRIDGIIVTEQAVRETAAETWTDGVTAATRFLMLSHLFLTHYYDNKDHQGILKTNVDKQLKELIKESTEMLAVLREKLDQSAPIKELQHKIERVTPNLVQLATNLELVLPIAPEGVEPHSSSLQELNKNLLSLIESKKLPKKSSK